MAMTASVTQALADELQRVIGDATCAQVGVDAAVATLELPEYAEHRLGGRCGNATDALALGLRAGLGQPGLVPRPKPILADRVVGGDLRVVNGSHTQEKCGEQ